MSMSLTAINRLLRRCGVRPAQVGVLHLSPTLLDRSKSMKTELMARVEAGAYADVEGVDQYGASAGAVSALTSCVNWAQSESWDGRWGVVAVCSNDQVAPTGLPLSSASAAAVLVGRGAPLPVGDACAHVLRRPHSARGVQMAPLPDEQPRAHQRETRSTRFAQIGSRGEASRWPLARALKRVSAAHASFTPSAVLAQFFASVPANSHIADVFQVEELAMPTAMLARPLLDATAFAVTCAQHAAALGHLGWVARPPSNHTFDTPRHLELVPPSPAGSTCS